MPKPQSFISPAGIAGFSAVRTPDTKFKKDGVFKVPLTLALDPEGTEAEFDDNGNPKNTTALLELLDTRADEAFSNLTEGKTVKEKKKISRTAPYTVDTDDDDVPTGTVTMTFKQNAKIKKKDGSIQAVTIPVFNTKGKEFKGQVFAGFTVKVSFNVNREYLVQTSGETVVCLDMRAVQVLQSTESSGASASRYGFGEEEGYSTDTHDADDDDADGSEDNTPDDGEGDF